MRPIDADALCEGRVSNDPVVIAAKCAPTLDCAPVVHGEWKYYHKLNKAVCLSCSFERDLDADFGKAICCPNCGAKMDGGKEG